MARLISPPVGLMQSSFEFLAGPRSINASSTESVRGYIQSTSSPWGDWRLQFSFPPMRGRALLDYEGWIADMNGGANATRWHFYDPDVISFQEAGVLSTPRQEANGVPWSNDLPWSNGKNWALSRPPVAAASASPSGGTTISLVDSYWGHHLRRGAKLGVAGHFAMYMVTQVISPGVYRVTRPVRRAIVAGDLITLRPTLALRLESEAGAPLGRGLTAAENLTVTFVEVRDEYVRTWFAD